ncbi:MAG: hypothetical protein U0354_11930 [Candidatus Sericytochromatia bacterium]
MCSCVRKGILSNIISSQIDIHSQYGGVVPEIASQRQRLLTINLWKNLRRGS